jgi:Ras-related protein Rab-1A
MEQDYDYLFKIAILGDSFVGKTSILQRFSEDIFETDFNSTIGIDLRIKTIIDENNKKIKLQLWEVSGQENYKCIGETYYRHCHGIIFIFDLTDKQSFININSWLESLKKIRQDDYMDVPKILVGNKADMKKERKVSHEEIIEFSLDSCVKYIECSAKDGAGVNEIFSLISKQIKTDVKYLQKFENRKGVIKLESTTKANRECCYAFDTCY